MRGLVLGLVLVLGHEGFCKRYQGGWVGELARGGEGDGLRTAGLKPIGKMGTIKGNGTGPGAKQIG